MKKHLLFFLLGGIFALMIAIGIGRFAYTPILPLMQNDLGFSDAFAGYLGSSNYAGYFVGAILVGFLPLQRNRTLILRWSILFSVVTTLLMGLTYVYAIMFIVRFISGVASAFVFILASSIVLDRLAQSGKTAWAGHFYSGVGLGILLSTLFIPTLNATYSWEGAWIGIAIISAILAVFVGLWLKESDVKEITIKEKTKKPPVQTPPRKWLIWLIIAYGLEGLGYVVTGTFIVSLAEQTAIFTMDSSIVWVIVGIGAIPSCIMWSNLAEKFGYVRTLIIAMILQAVGIALPVFWVSQTSFIVSAFLFGATFMGVITLATTLMRQLSPTNSSRMLGYLTAVFAIGQMIGPSLAGVLIDYTGSFYTALLGASAAIFIGAILLISGIRYDRLIY